MEDAVRITDEEFRRIYELAFRSWASLHARAVNDPQSPDFTELILRFLHQPQFPNNLALKSEYGQLFAAGRCSWSTGGSTCGLPPFTTPVKMAVTRKLPVKVFIQETNQTGSDLLSSEDYISVLVPAWAYILSARWAETMRQPCSITYTDDPIAMGLDGQNAIIVDIGEVEEEETRWWTSVLTQGRGWQAAISSENGVLASPWSIELHSTRPFVLSTAAEPLDSKEHPTSFTEANGYLQRFCERHGIFDQSCAALSAAILLPTFGSAEEMKLPAPTSPAMKPESLRPREGLILRDLLHQTGNLDRCIVASCYTKGIRPTLLHGFYECSIECNAATPWLQGSIAAIKSLPSSSTDTLWRIIASRAPASAWLWLGAVVLGLRDRLLREVGWGSLPVDLVASAWTGSTQSFMQTPVTINPITGGSVERADECRLLFLAQSEHHRCFPICPWKPFGSTPLGDTDIEVRKHADCIAHRLDYEGMSWDCDDGKTTAYLPTKKTFESPPTESLTRSTAIKVNYDGMSRGSETISENSTRSIFGWLRFDGHGKHEKAIWEHEWFTMLDSSDGEASEADVASTHPPAGEPEISQWVVALPL